MWRKFAKGDLALTGKLSIRQHDYTSGQICLATCQVHAPMVDANGVALASV